MHVPPNALRSVLEKNKGGSGAGCAGGTFPYCCSGSLAGKAGHSELVFPTPVLASHPLYALLSYFSLARVLSFN